MESPDLMGELVVLTIKEIFEAAAPVKLGRADSRQRCHLLKTISQLRPLDRDRIRAAASLKRKRDTLVGGSDERAAKCQKACSLVSAQLSDEHPRSEDDEFLEAPREDIVKKCIANFIDRTGNSALRTKICMVCAREVANNDTTVMLVRNIPNPQHLVPTTRHAAHDYTSGYLLHTSAMSATTSGPEGAVCNECLTNLQKNRLPRLALANDMWIGQIPLQLAVLTLPEQVLIARYFPSTHIVKLYPQKKGARSGNCALRGNVSTYRLNTDEISEMVQGNVMPNPARILASTIGVTIIGPRIVTEKTMPNFLWVRRDYVRQALIWLKANNPVYANIVLSEDRLDELGENSVPDEILGAVRHSDNIEELERERAGYVPEDGDVDRSHTCDANTQSGNFEDYVSGTTGMLSRRGQ